MIVNLSRLNEKNKPILIKGELHIYGGKHLHFYADHPFKCQMNNGLLSETEIRLTITDLSMDKHTIGVKGLILLEGKEDTNSARYGREYLTFNQWFKE